MRSFQIRRITDAELTGRQRQAGEDGAKGLMSPVIRPQQLRCEPWDRSRVQDHPAPVPEAGTFGLCFIFVCGLSQAKPEVDLVLGHRSRNCILGSTGHEAEAVASDTCLM